MPEELAQQFPLVKEMLNLFDINIFEIDGFEADDINRFFSKTCWKEWNGSLYSNRRQRCSSD